MPLMPECEKWKQCIWNNVSIWRIEDCESCVAACYFWQQWVTHETSPTPHPHPLLPLDKNWSRPNSTSQKKQLLDCMQVWRETKKTNERSTMPKPCLYVYVTVYMDMCVWVCVCVCMSVCCCTLGSSCRFEVGSPGAHSDNCTSIIFCSSILCFFFLFTVLHYLNICLIAAYYFFLCSRFARELSKLKNMTKFGSGRSARRQCEFIAGCVGIYPCNCSTHTVTMYV